MVPSGQLLPQTVSVSGRGSASSDCFRRGVLPVTVLNANENLCYIGLGADFELKSTAGISDKEKSYELLDGNIFTVVAECFCRVLHGA